MSSYATYHSETINIIDGENHEAFFVTELSPKNLLIYVHGFNGQTTKTWDKFPSMLKNDSSFSESDIIFYGYPSLEKQATDHAVDFYNFLKNELDFDKKISHIGEFARIRGLKKRDYKKIVIIAHSLGAIIVREALLYANREKMAWLNQINMILFAPAHMGITKIKDLVVGLMDINLILKFIGRVIEYRHPILLDLERDSAFLKKIKDDTQELLRKGEGEFTKAKTVIHAAGDRVVSNVQFCDDPIAVVVNNKSHINVCKPIEESYVEPITQVRNIIK